MELVERVKDILIQPKKEWQVIAKETATVQGIFVQYVMILAAIPAVASFIGWSLVGFGGYRVPVAYGVAQLVTSYVLTLAMVYVLALIIDALAPQFGGEKNFIQALKVAAYSLTAWWIAGVFFIFPLMAILAILGLYSLFLLYVGLPMLMKSPEDKALAYTAVVIIATIVLAVVIAALASLVIPGRMRGF